MQQRPIGNRTVSAIGLGEMPLSIEGRPDRRQAIATIHASLDAGVTIIDTADAYSLGVQEHGHGEELVAEALAAYGGATDDVLVATKGGHRRPGDGSWTVHGDPSYVKEACEASLKALASTPSASTSTTAPILRSRGPSRWAPWLTSWTKGRS